MHVRRESDLSEVETADSQKRQVSCSQRVAANHPTVVASIAASVIVDV